MIIKNKEIEKRIKNGDFSDFKSKNELGEWLIASERMKLMSDLDDWMRTHIPKEQVYQKKIMDFIRRKTENGELPASFVWKEQSGPYQRGGLPDVIAVIKPPNESFGRMFFFEVKRPFFGKLSPLQKQTIEKIRSAGGVAEVVFYPWEVDTIFKNTDVYIKNQ